MEEDKSFTSAFSPDSPAPLTSIAAGPRTCAFPSTGATRESCTAVTHLGIISDTHGVLEPEVERSFRSADLQMILHAGDIGSPEIIRRLSTIAPLLAVCGNCDSAPYKYSFPLRESLCVGTCKILLIHDLGQDDRPTPDVLAWIHEEKPRVIVFGHLHRPVVFHREGIIYFNPGSAGFVRDEMPRSFGFLRIEEGIPSPSIENIPD